MLSVDQAINALIKQSSVLVDVESISVAESSGRGASGGCYCKY